MDKAKIEDRASRATKALEATWEMLRRMDERIPPAVILALSIGDREVKKGHVKWGHFANSSWQYNKRKRTHEIGINPALFGNAHDVLATMIHEAAHAILWPDHNAGMGSTPYYHTTLFRNICQEFSLQCEFRNCRYGYTDTSWLNGKAPKIYEPLIRHLKEHLPYGAKKQRLQKGKPKELPPAGRVKMECKCNRSFYIARGAEKEGIYCTRCENFFEEPPEKNNAGNEEGNDIIFVEE